MDGHLPCWWNSPLQYKLWWIWSEIQKHPHVPRCRLCYVLEAVTAFYPPSVNPVWVSALGFLGKVCGRRIWVPGLPASKVPIKTEWPKTRKAHSWCWYHLSGDLCSGQMVLGSHGPLSHWVWTGSSLFCSGQSRCWSCPVAWDLPSVLSERMWKHTTVSVKGHMITNTVCLQKWLAKKDKHTLVVFLKQTKTKHKRVYSKYK